jgi:hypothetical protein
MAIWIYVGAQEMMIFFSTFHYRLAIVAYACRLFHLAVI